MLKFKAFTLAEIMIALTIIGVITAILLPVAIQTTPNEKVMKFKKANATLAKVINELVTSGEYYTPGDLGMKPDGTAINGDHNGDYTYFCETIADLLTTKKVNCAEYGEKTNDIEGGALSCSDWVVTNADEGGEYGKVDKNCKLYANNLKEEIVTIDNVIFYETYSTYPFGWDKYYGNPKLFYEKISTIVGGETQSYKDYYNLQEPENAYRCKRVFCIDIDGIDKGEDPFGYGIRVDGKILLGARAQAWLEKDIQDKE